MGSFITSSILSYVFILSSYPTSIFVSFQGLIRAPTQGATKRRRAKHESINVSIHAPTQGATNIFSCLVVSFQFQSTLPRRERQQFQPKISSDLQQKSTNYHFKYLIFPFFHPLFVYTTRHLCTFKSANPPAFLCVLLIRTLILSQNQRVISCNSAIDTHMFHFCLILIS